MSEVWGFAARAVPWAQVTLASALIVGLTAAVRYDPWTLWPMQGTAVGLLAGAVGWCFDEPAAAVADPLPRGLAWQTAARLAGVGVLLATWSVGIWWCRDALFGHPWSVWAQGVAATSVTMAWVLWRRSAGEATPGHRWALLAVSVATTWALVHPARTALPVFPYGPTGGGDWIVSTIGWTVAGLVSLVGIAAVLADGNWRRVRYVPHHGRGREG